MYRLISEQINANNDVMQHVSLLHVAHKAHDLNDEEAQGKVAARHRLALKSAHNTVGEEVGRRLMLERTCLCARVCIHVCESILTCIQTRHTCKKMRTCRTLFVQ
jgi:hypothetical protein